VPRYGVIYARLRAAMFKRIAAGCSIQPGDRTLVAEVLGISERTDRERDESRGAEISRQIW